MLQKHFDYSNPSTFAIFKLTEALTNRLFGCGLLHSLSFKIFDDNHIPIPFGFEYKWWIFVIYRSNFSSDLIEWYCFLAYGTAPFENFIPVLKSKYPIVHFRSNVDKSDSCLIFVNRIFWYPKLWNISSTSSQSSFNQIEIF